jgi:leader peptidase (prepilin peptidase)/N-methyltransferase
MDAETGLLVHEFTYPGILLGLVFAWIAPGDAGGTWLLLEIFHKHIENFRELALLDAVLGALVGAAFFYITWALYWLVRKRHGLGFGDIALIAMSGAFLGLKLNLLVLVCGPILTLVYVFVLLAREAVRPRVAAATEASGEQIASDEADADSVETPFLQRELPFGVFLGVCALAAIFFGETAWAWYLGKFHRSVLSDLEGIRRLLKNS